MTDLNTQATQATPAHTAWIPEGNLYGLQQRIAEVQKRAKKIGAPVPTIEVVADRQHMTVETSDGPRVVMAVQVQVQGEVPVFAGWRAVAMLERAPEGDEPLIRFSSGFSTQGTIRCDHCGHNRKRNQAFVVRHDNGQEMVVGSTCVADFVPGTSPAAMLYGATYLHLLQGLSDGEFSRAPAHQYEVDEVIRFALAAHKTGNWMSKSRADDEGGVSTFAMYMGAGKLATMIGGTRANALYEALNQITDREVQEVLAWAETQRNEGDYGRNLAVLAACGMVEKQHVAILLSAPAGYAREQAKAAREAAQGEQIVPPEGKMLVHGEVQSMKVQETVYGSQLKMLLQCNGYRLWGSVPAAISDVKVGNRVEFSATVSAKETGFGFYSRPTKARIV